MNLRFQRPEYLVAASNTMEYKFHYTLNGDPHSLVVGIDKSVTKAWGLPFWEDSRPKGFERVVKVLFHFGLEFLKRKGGITKLDKSEYFYIDPSFAQQKLTLNTERLPVPTDYEVTI